MGDARVGLVSRKGRGRAWPDFSRRSGSELERRYKVGGSRPKGIARSLTHAALTALGR
jgi:hypothetical protein